jgi:hypothetical protein
VGADKISPDEVAFANPDKKVGGQTLLKQSESFGMEMAATVLEV